MSIPTQRLAPPRKPDPTTAMTQLILQVREAVDFDIPPAQLCDGPCTGCPKKLLEFLDTELIEWEQQLALGQQPGLGDIQKLARTSKKVHRVLAMNGLA